MSSRRIDIDWGMVAGFGGLLFLIIIVGAIGIQQIQGLSRVIGRLAKQEMPMQNAVLEMKSGNSKFAMSIRNYIFWRNARYLDAASVSEKLNLVRTASQDFDKYLKVYESFSDAPSQKEWVYSIRANEFQLRHIADNIIDYVNKLEKAPPEEKAGLDDALNKQLMDFENKLFEIDYFLDNPVQQFNRHRIDTQLVNVEKGKERSLGFLAWSLFLGLVLGGQTAYLIYRRSKRERERREFLWRKVISVEEDQKNDLSLQIHDQMGQDLSALKIYLGLIEHDLAPERAQEREKIDKTKKILDTLMAKAHNISELLRPPELDDLGLVESIAALVLHYKEMTGVNYNYIRPVTPLSLSAEASLVLYRVIQEALTNIAKHSDASNIDISLDQRDNAIYLLISDDGAGFDYNAYLNRPARRKEDKLKLGLQGLRERIELLGGKMTIDTKPGKGTKLKVVLPEA